MTREYLFFICGCIFLMLALLLSILSLHEVISYNLHEELNVVNGTTYFLSLSKVKVKVNRVILQINSTSKSLFTYVYYNMSFKNLNFSVPTIACIINGSGIEALPYRPYYELMWVAHNETHVGLYVYVISRPYEDLSILSLVFFIPGLAFSFATFPLVMTNIIKRGGRLRKS